MKKIALLAFLCTFGSTFAEEFRIGVVNISFLLENAPQAKLASDNLSKEFQAMEQELITTQKTLQQMQQDFVKNRELLSPTQAKTRERRIMTMERDLKRSTEDFKELLNIRRNEELSKVQDEIKRGIQEVGARDNYDLIFYEGVTYASERANLTPIVLRYLKEQHADTATQQ